MKLNIGSGHLLFGDCINMDLEIYTNTKGKMTDVLGDAKSLPFKDNSVERTYMIHCLEHLNKWDGFRAIKEAFRVLKAGGRLMVESPDLFKSFMEYSATPIKLASVLYGAQEEDKENLNGIHKWGYTPEMVVYRMREAGFKDIKWGEGRVHKCPERDFQIWGTKPTK